MEALVRRPSWDEYFMNIATEVARRSNCLTRHVAALVVRDKRIISTGYNGTPRNTKNCYEGGCKRCAERTLGTAGTKLEECTCSHGEENAIVQSSYHGISLKDATLYTTYSPCLLCAKMIINAGIKEVIYAAKYPLSDRARDLMLEAGVWLRQYEAPGEPTTNTHAQSGGASTPEPAPRPLVPAQNHFSTTPWRAS